MKFIKNNVDIQYNDNLISELSKKFDLDKEIIKLLFARGFDSEQKIEDFLNPKLSNFYNPFLLKNMREVVDKINYYVNNKKNITIVGDYDTDGISASSILYKYFDSIGVKVDVFLPQRQIDGYGLSNESIDKIINLYHPDLIITVDCGISSHDEVEYCKEKGLDIIITDHHDIPDVIPETLIINAKLPNQMYPFHDLCGAGVALKLVQALSGLENAMKYTSIASLATVADIVPLVDENRTIVYYGLRDQIQNLPKGIKQLAKKADIKLPFTTSDISFKLSPKLNAPGRMGDAMVSFKVFVENDDKELDNYINQLIEINDERITQTNKIYDDCIEKLKCVNISKLGAIVLYDDNWEGGVLGIICSKLVEKYNRPVCLLSLNDTEYKGSVRSINGINIYNILNEIKHILLRFGGHNQAGGLSLAKENIKEFRKLFNNAILSHYDESNFLISKKYDLEIPKNLSIKFMEQIERLEPFGMANERPIFLMNLNNVKATRLTNFPQHIKIKQDKLEVMAFNMGHLYYNLNSNSNKQALVELNLEKFKNTLKVKGTIRRISFSALHGMKKSDIPHANYLQQLNFIKTNKPEKYNVSSLKYGDLVAKSQELTKRQFGTVFVTYDFANYQKLLKQVKNINNFEMFTLNNVTGINTIIFSPNYNIDLSAFENVVFLEVPLCDGFLYSLKNENIYIVDNQYNINIYKSINTDRNVFARYHQAIKNAIDKGISATNLVEYFSAIKKLNPQYNSLNYKQFIFVEMVLTELGILKQIDDVKYELTNVKSELKNSTIYNNILLLNKL